jgi:hypothetical protein
VPLVARLAGYSRALPGDLAGSFVDRVEHPLCGEASSDASPSPYSPGVKVAPGLLLIAVVTNTRSPQTIGLECARPGMAVRHRMFSPVRVFQLSGRFCPSATLCSSGQAAASWTTVGLRGGSENQPYVTDTRLNPANRLYLADGLA